MFVIVSIIVAIIVIIVILLFNKNKNITENFAGETTTTPKTTIQQELTQLLNTITSPVVSDGTYEYIEPLTDIPFYQQLLLYATIFSTNTHYNKAQKVYVPEMSRLNNFIKEGQEFMIINTNTNTLPSTIKHPYGIPLKNVSLSGINADTINQIDFSLTAFTVTMVLKWNSFADIGSEIELFSISLESPNYIRLTIENDPDTTKDNVFLYSHVGDTSEKSKSGISIPKTDFNNEIAISMVYSKIGENCVRRIYINNVQAYESAPYIVSPDLVLGNSKIIINKGKNLDASLYSFMYYKKALTLEEHNMVYEYYKKQVSSVPAMMTFVKTVTSETIDGIKKLIDDSTVTEENLKEKLDQCLANSPPPAPQEFKYKIKGTGSVGLTDAEKASCPLFKIKKRVEQAPTPTPAPTFPYNIRLPSLS